MGHDKKKSAAPPPGPGPLPYLKKLVHPCVRLPIINFSGNLRVKIHWQQYLSYTNPAILDKSYGKCKAKKSNPLKIKLANPRPSQAEGSPKHMDQPRDLGPRKTETLRVGLDPPGPKNRYVGL
jgi:hypothetical protein